MSLRRTEMPFCPGILSSCIAPGFSSVLEMVLILMPKQVMDSAGWVTFLGIHWEPQLTL